MSRVKNNQVLVFVLLAVLMLATLGCSSADMLDSLGSSDSPDLPDSLDALDSFGQDGIIVDDSDDGDSESDEEQGSKDNGEADLDGNGQAGADKTLTCTYSINCSTIFDNLDKISEAVLSLQPKDGWIFSPKEIEFQEGESVFDILLRLSRQEKIHMEFNSNPALNSKYVEGINNLYEFDAGELSGWTYKINGKGMGYGSSSSYPKDGDTIEWLYTCDQGRDLGFEP